MPQTNMIESGTMFTGTQLDAEYRRRKSGKTIHTVQKGSPIPPGYTISREFKASLRLEKPKPFYELWEDRVWCAFFEMGIKSLNSKGLSILIRASGKDAKNLAKQQDIVAVDDEFLFVIECKSKESLGPHDHLRSIIGEIVANRPNIIKSLSKHYSGRKPVFALATENTIWDENLLAFAREKGIKVFDEYTVDALLEFTKVAGRGAKYQVFNQLFQREKISNFHIKVPAIESRMGKKTFYSFSIEPIHLLKIGYVHQRQQSSLIDISETYQRMLRPSRLTSIRNYIENGGFFPGSIIINFNRKLKDIERIGTKKQIQDSSSEARPVMLTLPPYYGSAWIIDGQHRLYGYADLSQKHSEMVPVVAFVNEDVGTQAQIFIDINQNQKSIESDLKWDLYEDLYAETEEIKYRDLWRTSVVAKELQRNPLSPIAGMVTMPAGPKAHITLTNLCSALKSNRITTCEGPLGHLTELEVFARVCEFLSIIRDLLPTEWDRKEGHFPCSSSGLTISLALLADLLHSATQKEIASGSQFQDFLLPFIDAYATKIHALTEKELGVLRERTASFGGRPGVTEEFIQHIQSQVPFRSLFLEQRENRKKLDTILQNTQDNAELLLKLPESETFEVKGSLHVDLDNYLKGDGEIRKKPDLPREGVLKTIAAMLNTSGGTLLIGAVELAHYQRIREEKKADLAEFGDYLIVGIDLEFDRKGWDGFELRLRDLLEKQLSEEVILEGIRINRLEYEGKTLCSIQIARGSSWHYVNGKEFYIREGNRTKALQGSLADKYKKRNQR